MKRKFHTPEQIVRKLRDADAVAKVKFWYEKDLTLPAPNVIVRAETSGDYWNIGDWHDSAPITFGTTWPTDEITCVSEATINSEVEYRDYSAEWKYKCPDGTNEWITTTTQNNCRLYVVLNTPTQPQSEPWKGVLDIACDVAWGCEKQWTKYGTISIILPVGYMTQIMVPRFMLGSP